MSPFSFLSFVGGIRGLISMVALLAICWTLHGWRVSHLMTSHAKAMTEQEQSLRAECAENARRLEEINNGYVSRIKDINSRHANAVSRLLRHEAGKASGSTRMDDGAAGSNAVHRTAGILDLAAEAERNTAKLIGCQSYIRSLP